MKRYLLSMRIAVLLEAENDEDALQIQNVKVSGENGICNVLSVSTIDQELEDAPEDDEEYVSDLCPDCMGCGDTQPDIRCFKCNGSGTYNPIK